MVNPLRFGCLCLTACVALTAARGQTQGAPAAVPGTRSISQISAGWRFQMDVSDLGEKEQWYGTGFDRSAWAKVSVPKAWDLYDEALWGYEGLGWYAARIDGRLARKGQAQRLKFGRVNYHSKVWLNGELLGENVIGYLPFEFDVTGKLNSDRENILVLRVDNKARLSWLPGAKQIEWIQYGGILEPVALETSATVYISDLTINAVPEGAGASIHCAAEITSQEATAKEIVLRLGVAGHPQSVKSVTLKVAPGSKSAENVVVSLKTANPWSPEKPFQTCRRTSSPYRDRPEYPLCSRNNRRNSPC